MSGCSIYRVVKSGVTYREGDGTGSKTYWSLGNSAVRRFACGATLTRPLMLYGLFLVGYDLEVRQSGKVEAKLQL